MNKICKYKLLPSVNSIKLINLNFMINEIENFIDEDLEEIEKTSIENMEIWLI